ncbi:hypothetical protein HK405_009718 [Cladochytrium tenue]|nr:hypothetical protein HK405_009718 [Cladochytrium tenue]
MSSAAIQSPLPVTSEDRDGGIGSGEPANAALLANAVRSGLAPLRPMATGAAVPRSLTSPSSPDWAIGVSPWGAGVPSDAVGEAAAAVVRATDTRTRTLQTYRLYNEQVQEQLYMHTFGTSRRP